MQTKHVYKAIAEVAQKMAAEGISKSRKNQQQGYNFRGIDEIYNALASHLAASGLVIIPRILSREFREVATKSGGLMSYVIVEAEYDLVSAQDGSTHTARVIGEAMDSADKATNKAMSAAYKYLCLQTFCIPTEGDNDADAHTHERQAPATTPLQPATAPPAPALPWLNENTEEFTKVVEAVRGGYTIADVRKKYAVSKKTEAAILKAASAQ